MRQPFFSASLAMSAMGCLITCRCAVWGGVGRCGAVWEGKGRCGLGSYGVVWYG